MCLSCAYPSAYPPPRQGVLRRDPVAQLCTGVRPRGVHACRERRQLRRNHRAVHRAESCAATTLRCRGGAKPLSWDLARPRRNGSPPTGVGPLPGPQLHSLINSQSARARCPDRTRSTGTRPARPATQATHSSEVGEVCRLAPTRVYALRNPTRRNRRMRRLAGGLEAQTSPSLVTGLSQAFL